LTVVDDTGSLWKFRTPELDLLETDRFEDIGPNGHIALSEDATLALSIKEDGRGKVWDVNSRRRLHEFPPGGRWGREYAIASDGRSIARDVDDQKVVIWSSTGIFQNSIEGPSGGLLLFSPSGDFLSAFGWAIHEPSLWEIATRKRVKPRQGGHRSSIDVEAFAADGSTLATGSEDGSIILWSVPDLDRRGQLPTHGAAVDSLVFSPDGRSIVAGYRDGLIRIWEVESGLELAVLERHSGPVVRVCISPDGQILATCGRTGTGDSEIFVWPSRPGK
jgi:WD40 repeat protein